MPDYQFTIGNYPTKLSSRVKILTGQRFHRLLVIGFAGLNAEFKAMWHCLCDCGNGRTLTGSVLRSNLTFSCGCYRIEHAGERNFRHGDIHTPEYKAFSRAKNRCANPRNQDYSRYGQRGIEFRFNSFEEFLKDIGRKPSPKHSLDRINNEGHYEKGNVKWSTAREQARNRRTTRYVTANGLRQSAGDWGDRISIAEGTIRHRLRKGWCEQCAATLPLRSHCPHR